MITVEEFRSAIRSNNLETVLDDILLGDAAAHVTATNIDHLRDALVRRIWYRRGHD